MSEQSGTTPEGMTQDPDREESPGERLDRQWSELLQELRVVQTGIQLLGGFLLIVPFQARFLELSEGLLLVYLISVASATLAVFFVLAPVVMHRVLFSTRRKDVLVAVGGRLAQSGLVLLAVTVTGVAAITYGLVLGDGAAIAAGLVAAVVCIGLWWGLAAALGRRPPSERY